jgi:hypothetical protein
MPGTLKKGGPLGPPCGSHPAWISA